MIGKICPKSAKGYLVRSKNYVSASVQGRMLAQGKGEKENG